MSGRLKLRTYWRLGPANLARVGLYRLGLRAGLHPVQRVRCDIGGADFFSTPPTFTDLPVTDFWRDDTHCFGWHRGPLSGGTPDWHTSPMDGRTAGGGGEPWWTLSDFNLPVEDIKTVWELSRMDWVLALAQRAAAGDAAELIRLNTWLADWCAANRTFLGVNWKCGQEASIRVMHLALAARLLGQDTAPSADLARLVEAHLARIHPTLSYAMAQDNNHGTSEAAALFIGGTLCAAGGVARGTTWARDGRRWLENRARRLVAPDGSFSQYSLNYHRVLLDTFCLVERWRRWHDLPAFSVAFLDRAHAATEWLYHMIEPQTGDGPNFGANDGANFLPLTDADYRDFRPTVQLAMALFSDRLAYPGKGPHQTHLAWLQVAQPQTCAAPPRSRHFADGGYAVLRKGPWTALFNYPRFRFRPNHCDVLHLDLWHGPHNLLRDAGTYGYNTDAPWQDYFPGTVAHNTVAFDEHEQMPSVSRFLRGAWPGAHDVGFSTTAGDSDSATAGYTDWRGCRHVRCVQMDVQGVVVEDRVSGFARRAILRWRLLPGAWALTGQTLRGEYFALSIAADVDIFDLKVVDGWESRYYLQKTPLPVLEVELRTPGTITTRITRHG